MKYILAPDSFKGTLNQTEVIKIMKEVILEDSLAEVVEIPLADGGEGTLDIIISALKGEIKTCYVYNPLMKEINSYFGVIKDTAVIEMAKASGLTLIAKEKRNPLITTTYGTGQLILKALDMKVKKIIIGIGGSATNDGGMGMAAALGVKFYDSENKELSHGGFFLEKIHHIDISKIDERVFQTEIEVMCDVSNPLTGVCGATYVYGPQKGGNKSQIMQLENGMLNYISVIEREFDINLNEIKGSGAAGGLGAGLVVFLKGKLKSGISSILDLLDFKEEVKNADIIITGEGKFDEQSLQGKVIDGIIEITKNEKCKLVIVAGYTNIKHLENVDLIISTTKEELSEEELQSNCKDNLKKTMRNVIEYTRSQYE